MWFFHFLVSEPVSFSLGTIVDRIQCILSTMFGYMTVLLAVSFVTVRYFTVGQDCYYSRSYTLLQKLIYGVAYRPKWQLKTPKPGKCLNTRPQGKIGRLKN